MKVILGADHAATSLKEAIKKVLQADGYAVEDVSPSTPQAGDDYPDYAFPVAERVAADPENMRGILVCDTGVGMAVAANKVGGIHAALVTTADGARLARDHNDANVLVFGAELTSPEEAVQAARTFLTTPFSGDERHVRRLRKIAARDRGGSVH